ncbi:MAG: flagellar FliJ family protein [Wigglesworthia glossinidia]|nr:flagellar FliJ family protein [Wigglesworthia glossinidia]
MKLTFKVLKIHAKIDFQEACLQLKKTNDIYIKLVKKLNILIFYETEYRRNLQESMIKYGLNIEIWNNYQTFLICLCDVISEHNKQINSYKLKVNIAKNNWKKKRQIKCI